MADNPTDEETQRWFRHLGSQANNRAWVLAEQAARSPEEDAEMLDAAHASRYLWSKVGTERNLALANLLLGHVHALLGAGPAAMRYAVDAFGYLTSHESQAWELAFAHAALANAAHAAGRNELHREHYAKAAEVANTMTSEEDRKIFDASFIRVPRPAQAG
ncbi:MAG: hypothetical protein ACM338_08175 [Betaproteobacteria bacterium]